MSELVLYGNPGWGSALVEAQLDWLGLAYRYEEVGNLFTSAEARERMRPVNPLMQVPTLVLEDGRVLTESAAITLHLADLTGRDDLVPGPEAPERAEFLRWLVYFVANVYPTFTYADHPARFVGPEAARQPFREAVDTYAKRLYRVLEEAAGGPWFLGERFSALDIYVAVATRWRPRREWFAKDALPQLEPMRARNFPKG
jgi:GST-like protein